MKIYVIVTIVLMGLNSIAQENDFDTIRSHDVGIHFKKFETSLNDSHKKYLDSLFTDVTEVIREHAIQMTVFEYKEEYYSDEAYGLLRAKKIILYLCEKYRMQPYHFVIRYQGYTGDPIGSIYFSIF